jgi:hypothetical protein
MPSKRRDAVTALRLGSSDTEKRIRRGFARLYDRDGETARRQIAENLVRELLALPERSPIWLKVGANEILALVDFHGSVLEHADFKAILAKVLPDLEEPWQFAYWRALCSLRTEYGDPIWDSICEDFVSEDELVFINASPVVVPALEHGDTYVEQKLADLRRALPEDDPIRDRIDRALAGRVSR